MVSRARDVGAGILITLGSSIIISGVVLLVHAEVMDANNNSIPTPESTAFAVGAVMAILFGIGIAAFSKILLEETEKDKEDKKLIEAKKDLKIEEVFKSVASGSLTRK